jgi:serralysin
MDIEDFDGTIVRVPVEHTVWYKIAGTGRSITVDTAGSSYDTVVAVYAGSADASATVACLDDTPLQPFGRTLQTSVTFPTTVGTTYWVQIGGINEGVFGDDTNVPYGNLRVRVR